MSVDVNVNTTETNVNINASTVVETIDITATVQQDDVIIEVFPNVTVVNVTKKEGEDGADGQDGKSAYQSYIDTTSDDPKLSEEEWSRNYKIFTIQFNSTNTTNLNKWETGSHSIGYLSATLQIYAGTTVQLLATSYESNMGGYVINVFKNSKLRGIIFQAGLIQGTVSNIELLVFAKKKVNNSHWASNDSGGIILYNDFIPVTTNNTQIFFRPTNIPDITIPSGYYVQFAIRKTTAIYMNNAAISFLID